MTGRLLNKLKIAAARPSLRIFLFTLSALTIFASFSTPSANASISTGPSTPAAKKSHPDQSNINTETETLIRAAIAEAALATARDINNLTVKISNQEVEIKALHKQIANFEKPGDINTITIVLTCVSVLITILGVVFAILSIFGYTNIREEAARSAKTAAKDTVEKITKEELPAETERNIIKLIETKRFDSIIQEAVEKIVYRGISIEDNTLEEEGLN